MVVLAAALLTGCAPRLELRTRHIRLAEQMRQAPIVLIGVLRGVTATGATAGLPGSPARARRAVAEVDVEHVLRGGTPQGRLLYSYFSADHGEDIQPPIRLAVGQRAVFLLEQDHGVLRPLTDADENTLPLTTSRHSFTSGPLPQQLAQACLTPGDERELNRRHWPDGISDCVRILAQLAGHQEALNLLTAFAGRTADPRAQLAMADAANQYLPADGGSLLAALQRSPNANLRAQACLEIWPWPDGACAAEGDVARLTPVDAYIYWQLLAASQTNRPRSGPRPALRRPEEPPEPAIVMREAHLLPW